MVLGTLGGAGRGGEGNRHEPWRDRAFGLWPARAAARHLAPVGVWITIIFIPFGVAAPVVPGVGEMFFALAAQLLVAGAYNPVAASILAELTPQRLMGKVTAIYLLVFTLLGRGLGPLLVAAISDAFFAGPQALGFALGSAAAALMAAALVAIALLLRRARRLTPAYAA